MDGTWNDEHADADDAVINIVKMRQLLARDSDEQVTRYFRGVGSDEVNAFFGKTWEGMTGNGEKQIRNAQNVN